MVITLVEKEVAKVGYSFTNLGPTKICDKCQLKKVCVDVLEKNHAYRVVEVRKKEHICMIENQPMLVCAVEEDDYIISVEKQKYLENMVLNRFPMDCKEVLCENYDYCMSPVFNDKIKVKINELIGDITCPLNFSLALVKIKIIRE